MKLKSRVQKFFYAVPKIQINQNKFINHKTNKNANSVTPLLEQTMYAPHKISSNDKINSIVSG